MSQMVKLPPKIDYEVWSVLEEIRHRVVIIGSVARGKRWPKDLDLLYDADSERAYKEINDVVESAGLKYGSCLPGQWSFMDYGWMVEILPFHDGPSYQTCRRSAEPFKIQGIEFMMAQARHCPKEDEGNEKSEV